MDLISRTRLHLLLVPLLLATAGCGDDATAPDDAGLLTEAEVEGLVEAVLALGADPEVAGSVPGPSRAPVTITIPVEEVLPCPLGGSLDLDGSAALVLDAETGLGSLEQEIVTTHAACRVRSERTGQVFMLDGAPSVTSTLSADIQAEEFIDLSGSEVGGVRWTLDDRSGTCEMALDYGLTGLAGGSLTYQATGTVCGREVDIQVSVEG